MVARLVCFARLAAPYALVVAMALLAVGTISNQIKINAANTQLRAQAENGQRSLTRQCKLAAIGRKFYADALRRGVITLSDFDLFVMSTQQACSPTYRP